MIHELITHTVNVFATAANAVSAAPGAITNVASLFSPQAIIVNAGPWALLVVCAIIFAETGLLIGFFFPGDTLLLITGLLAFNGHLSGLIVIDCIAIAFAAFAGGELGYYIGRKTGPPIFERKETGFFSKQNVERTNRFFNRYGGMSVILARFVPVVRTFIPVAAGVGHMPWKRYTLYNAVGALIWGSGITLLGWVLGFIPPVAAFVQKYIDVILIAAVIVAIVPSAYHLVKSWASARKRGAQYGESNPQGDEGATNPTA